VSDFLSITRKLLLSLWAIFWLAIPPINAIRALIYGYSDKENIAAGIAAFFVYGYLSIFISSSAYQYLRDIWKKEHPALKIARPTEIIRRVLGN